jgi:hypothetical protein
MLFESCEVRTNIGEREMAPNQIPPSALMEAFLGCGFGSGSVAVLVTIRDMSQSQIITVVRKKCCVTSKGSYQLVSLDHLQ